MLAYTHCQLNYSSCQMHIQHSLNAAYLYIKNWPEDGSLKQKHVANYIFIIIIHLSWSWATC